MLLTNFKRILKAGFLSFQRNGWLSTATILVMSLMMSVLGGLVLLGALAHTILTSLESKIDVSVFFAEQAREDEIFVIKDDLESLADVAEVTYVSKDAALETFRERHQNNALISDALTELGDNPLQASINIKARDPSNYAGISEFLLNKDYEAVEKINYFENQLVIERLGAVFSTVRGTGLFLALLLTFVAILVAFNTVRLAIHTMRDEIGVMRLVGATRSFVRGPFLIAGIIYGAISALITTLLFAPLVWLVSPRLEVIVPGFTLTTYFTQNLWEFFVILLVAGMTIGTTSSLIAMRKYLKV